MTLTGRSIVQVAVPSGDLKRSKLFYGETLGLTFIFETNGMAFYQAGNVRLMVGTNGEDPSGSKSGPAIYFDAPDLPDLSSKLQARGVEFLGPAQVVQKTDQGELQLQFFRDPDGNLLALMGLVQALMPLPAKKIGTTEGEPRGHPS